MKNNLEYECQLKDIEIQNMNKTVNELKNQLKIIGDEKFIQR
jgi:membrane-bound inhibitor of C-type lysozyme